MSYHTSMPLYLTYDNTSLADGYGAQLLRIIGIYSLAKKFHLKYLHSPIVETIEELSHKISNQSELDLLTSKVNKVFQLPSDITLGDFDKTITVKSLGFKYFLLQVFKYRFSKKHVLLKILLPFPTIEKFPNSYKIATRQIRSSNHDLFDSRPNQELVVHVRMGYGQNTPVASHVKPRYLPLSYYVELLKLLIDDDPLLHHVKLLVHTDIPVNSKVWTPTSKRLRQNIEFGENVIDSSIEVSGQNITQHFSDLGFCSIEIISEGDFFDTFIDMANSKRLAISRSAYSYLAALFNENEVVWPSGYWHCKLSRWKSSREVGLTTEYNLIAG